MGNTEESPLYELRQNVEGTALLLQSQYIEESSRRKTLLPVSDPLFFFDISTSKALKGYAQDSLS